MNHTALSNAYDDAFRSAKELKWLPWVGMNYSVQSAGQRMLIVGESHYHDGTKTDLKKWDNENQTRMCITEAGIEHASDNGWKGGAQRTFENTRITLGSRNLDRKQFWSDVAFYNFIQRPMSSRTERPSPCDWKIGWKTFVEVCKVVSPSHCIFIGVTAANWFNPAMDEMRIAHAQILKSERITGDIRNGCWGRTAGITIGTNTININFILHASRIKQHCKWHDFLKAKNPNITDWLNRN